MPLVIPPITRQAAFFLLLAAWTVVFSNPSSAQQSGVADSQFRLARQFEQLGQYQQAANLYKTLYENYPQNYTYFEGLRRNLLRIKKYPELINLIQTRLRQNPRDIQLQTQLGDVYFRMGDEIHAYRVWNGILQKYPRNPGVYRIVASVMLQNRLFDKAIDVYLQGRKAIGKRDLFAMELAQLYTFQQIYPKAADEYIRFLKDQPYQLPFVQNQIARFPLDETTFPAVEKAIQKWVKKYPKNYALRKVLAGFYQSFGDYNSALKEILVLEKSGLSGSRKRRVPGTALYQFALDTYREKEFAISEKAFQKLLSDFPNFPRRDQATYYFADISYKTREYDRAQVLYKQVIERYPKSSWSLEALLRLGDIFLNQKHDPEQAIRYFQRIVQNFPNTRQQITATFHLVDCYVAEGNLKKAVAVLQNSLRGPALSSGKIRSLQNEALFKLAQLDFYQKNFEGSLKTIKKILQNTYGKYDSPFVNDALDLQLLIQENKDDHAAALQLFASGMYLSRRNHYEAAVDSLLRAVSLDSQAPLADRALLEAGRIKEKTKDWYGAIKIYQLLVTSYSKSVYSDEALNRVGLIYEKDLKDFEKARQTYESILIHYPQSVLGDELRKKVRELEGQP
ncbi:MAG: tetratricopeptide repeat protein [Calditrichaeota bacterium]|nr:tetratricopeptide repeat protein [Calditrichota bacterium]